MANHDELNPNLETTTQKKLFDQRLIVLSEGIHAASAKKIIEQLFAMEAADPAKEIWLFLNSPGGEVNSGFGIYDTIRFIRPEVKIVVTGLAASAATVVLLAAQSKYRYSMPNSRLLIHQPLIGGSIQGQASDIEIHAKEILKTREKIAELYTKETKQPIERVRKDIERDYWMTSQEALEYGLISRVISSWNEVK
ncbi:ATP-dependent Clp protease proteolytic subunit [Pigmentibacter ruber]|uniref:ATP-dependent Clp protease proteolytic subunit n=1 Tax=Pigmentibacter ruber TaxID=2683196 RepID=UPI00131C0D2B|nr:ATP-dependent Clp protease proteolytic subunit [Pigmentibacter ruber]BFD32204.1 ATP-dependent Clp protease proteolytic subunit [Pigmentibacter ruber]